MTAELSDHDRRVLVGFLLEGRDELAGDDRPTRRWLADLLNDGIGVLVDELTARQREADALAAAVDDLGTAGVVEIVDEHHPDDDLPARDLEPWDIWPDPPP